MKVRGLVSLAVVFLACVVISMNISCGGSSGGGDSDDDNESSVPPGMALIPSGCFDMGDHFDESGGNDELPVHQVCITSDFYMDMHEVTNSEYKECVDAGACSAPSKTKSYTRNNYYGNTTYQDFPVIYVTYSQAQNYCSWAGKRLPTEAEWEYAARGGLSGKRYPNGDSISCTEANYGRYDSSYDCWNYDGLANDTHRVKSYEPNGYGLYDMAGNVEERVNDWFDPDYYQYCVDHNIVNDPQGPSSGSQRVLRGGPWKLNPEHQRVANRGHHFPTLSNFSVGFRCAKDAN